MEHAARFAGLIGTYRSRLAGMADLAEHGYQIGQPLPRVFHREPEHFGRRTVFRGHGMTTVVVLN